MPPYTTLPPRGVSPELGSARCAEPTRLVLGRASRVGCVRALALPVLPRAHTRALSAAGRSSRSQTRTCEGGHYLGRPRGEPNEHCSPVPRPMRRPEPTRGTPRYARLRRLSRAGRQLAPLRTASNLQLCAPTRRLTVSRACRARGSVGRPAREVGRRERGLGKGLSRPDPPSPLSPV